MLTVIKVQATRTRVPDASPSCMPTTRNSPSQVRVYNPASIAACSAEEDDMAPACPRYPACQLSAHRASVLPAARFIAPAPLPFVSVEIKHEPRAAFGTIQQPTAKRYLNMIYCCFALVLLYSSSTSISRKRRSRVLTMTTSSTTTFNVEVEALLLLSSGR